MVGSGSIYSEHGGLRGVFGGRLREDDKDEREGFDVLRTLRRQRCDCCIRCSEKVFERCRSAVDAVMSIRWAAHLITGRLLAGDASDWDRP